MKTSTPAALLARADALYDAGRWQQAEAVAREALAALADVPDGIARAEAENQLAIVLSDLGGATEAEALYRRALDRAERAAGSDSAEVAAILNNLGELLIGGARFAEGLEALDRAAAAFSAGPAASERFYATVQQHRAIGLYRSGSPEAALEAMREALRLRERVRGDGDRETAQARLNLAYLLMDDEPEAARSLAKNALAAFRAGGAGAHPDAASAAGLVALLSLDEDPEEAIRQLRDVVRIRRALVGPQHPSVGRDLAQLALALQQAGRYSESETRYREALDVVLETLPEADPDLALILDGYGVLLHRVGRYADADAWLRRALALREAHQPEGSADRTESLNNLAQVHHDQGAFSEARRLAEDVLARRTAALGPDHVDVGDAESNLGLLLDGLGDRRRAIPHLERALQVWRAALGPSDLRVALGEDHLALRLHEEGRTAEAVELLENALAIRLDAYGEDHPDVAYSLDHLGAVHQDAGDAEAAGELYASALALRRSVYAPGHPELLMSLNNLGTARHQQGRLEEAEALLQEALKEGGEAPAHPDVAHVWLNLAHVAASGGAFDRAAARALTAARVLASHADRALPALSLAEQRAFVGAMLAHARNALLSYAPRGGKLAEAYPVFASWKGLLVQALREQGLASRAMAGTETARALGDIRGAIARATIDRRDHDLSELELERERLERLLARLGSASAGRDGEPFRLAPGSALLDVYRYESWMADREDRYGVVVSAPGRAPNWVDLGAAEEMERRVTAWVRSGSGDRGTLSAWVDVVWAPLADLVRGATRVYVRPDGGLAQVPWFAVVDAATEGRAAAVVSPLGPAPAATGIAREPSTLLLISEIDYGTSGDPERDRFRPLEHRGYEADQIRAQARGLVPLRVGAPTPEAVRSAMERATYVHLLTHGFLGASGVGSASDFRDRALRSGVTVGAFAEGVGRSPLARSAIALEGANASAAGVLTAESLVGLDLRGTRLVTVAACESGIGEGEAGHGALGLQAALLAAGAEGVLTALWRVPDDATAELMSVFYEVLWGTGASPVEALREAQRVVRSTVRWEAPLYWAGWSLAGAAFDRQPVDAG